MIPFYVPERRAEKISLSSGFPAEWIVRFLLAWSLQSNGRRPAGRQ